MNRPLLLFMSTIVGVMLGTAIIKVFESRSENAYSKYCADRGLEVQYVSPAMALCRQPKTTGPSIRAVP